MLFHVELASKVDKKYGNVCRRNTGDGRGVRKSFRLGRSQLLAGFDAQGREGSVRIIRRDANAIQAAQSCSKLLFFCDVSRVLQFYLDLGQNFVFGCREGNEIRGEAQDILEREFWTRDKGNGPYFLSECRGTR